MTTHYTAKIADMFVKSELAINGDFKRLNFAVASIS